MQFYLAPMEGITGYVYRNAYHACFTDFDKYFTPFIVPNQNKGFTSRELNDVLPEHNQGMYTVPQILTNHSDGFIRLARELQGMGYKEVNLNLGCPSKTVVTKGRGAGFLAEPQKLDAFLEEIFEGVELKISIKTRLGMDEPEEFYSLLKIYEKYPLEELIIHPRVQADYYKNHANREMFREASGISRHSLCYNGDIFTEQDYRRFVEEFPVISKIMMGRGVLQNPGLVQKLKSGKGTQKETLLHFHNLVYEEYKRTMSGEKNVLFKMKEFWFYFIHSFLEGEKYLKKIRKAERLIKYDAIVREIFANLPLNG